MSRFPSIVRFLLLWLVVPAALSASLAVERPTPVSEEGGADLNARAVRFAVETYLDGAVDRPDRVVTIWAHLEACPECRDHEEFVRQLKAALARGPARG